MECSSYKGGFGVAMCASYVYQDVLKETLAWAIGRWLCIISDIMLF